MNPAAIGEAMAKRALALLLLLAAQAVHADALAPLQISGHPVLAEIADTPELRSQGLMFRNNLDANHGMLFVFPNSGRYSMWMKNTAVPLSVAFLDNRGVIINIADMKPFTEDIHTAEMPARFALEMPQGWFDKFSIHAGDKVTGLPAASKAK